MPRTAQRPIYRHILSLSLLGTSLLLGTAGQAHASERKTLSTLSPTYPEVAKRLRLTGMVRIQIQIAEDGSVAVVKVLGGHPLLADSAARAVAKWKYERGAAETKEVQVRFTLSD
jgi:TonB family protein